MDEVHASRMGEVALLLHPMEASVSRLSDETRSVVVQSGGEITDGDTLVGPPRLHG
jgi:hypothetical protein